MIRRLNLNFFLLLAFAVISLGVNLLGYSQLKKQTAVYTKLYAAFPKIKHLNTRAKTVLSNSSKSMITPHSHLASLKHLPELSKCPSNFLELQEESKQTILKMNKPITICYPKLRAVLQALEGAEGDREKYHFPCVQSFELKQSSGNPSLYTLNFQLLYSD